MTNTISILIIARVKNYSARSAQNTMKKSPYMSRYIIFQKLFFADRFLFTLVIAYIYSVSIARTESY